MYIVYIYTLKKVKLANNHYVYFYDIYTNGCLAKNSANECEILLTAIGVYYNSIL